VSDLGTRLLPQPRRAARIVVSNRVAIATPSNEIALMSFWSVMSNRNPADAARSSFSARLSSSQSPVRRIVESVSARFCEFASWRKRRGERKELYAFLASDHRIAADIGYRHQRG
jgi:hypothetical protein